MAKPPGPTRGLPSRGPSERGLHERLRTSRGRSTASQRWLARQLNDPYVKAAQAAGWRSRAAFKLLELDERFGLLKPGLRVVDLGAAPGGWSQVAARAIGPRGRLVALDLLPMEPVPGAAMLQGDFTEAATEAQVREALAGPADLVLSDMAPNTTGHGPTDNLRITALAELALDFAERVLAPGGGFVAKLLQGGAERGLLARLKAGFGTVRHAKPPASRSDSRELFVVATGFRGSPGAGGPG